MTILRTFAVRPYSPWQWSRRIPVAGFAIFIVSSTTWMADGWFESKSSLVIQNAILLFINILGVWRWLPRAEG